MKELTSEVINIDEWMEMNGPYLKPPVGNKCIFSGQLKVFLVAGPNQRSDYHVENGEEIFVMLKGDMILNVVEQGKPKSITIKEGEIFVLPKRIPHSPQRFEDTLGLVIERERLPEEMDCLRYYCDSNCDQVLYERWFHLVSLDIDIKQAIETFKDSVEFKTGQPTQKYDNSTVPHPDDLQIQTLSRICLLDWFKSNYQNISEGFASVWDSSKESKVGFYGPGKHIVVSVEHEIFVWHLGSHAKITIENNNRRKLAFNDSMIIGPGSVFTLTSDGPTFIASIKPTE